MTKWKLAAMAIVGAVFAIAGAVDYALPISEQIANNTLDAVFTALGLILSGTAGALTPKAKE